MDAREISTILNLEKKCWGNMNSPSPRKKLLSKLGHLFRPDLRWMGQGHVIISSLGTQATYLPSDCSNCKSALSDPDKNLHFTYSSHCIFNCVLISNLAHV